MLKTNSCIDDSLSCEDIAAAWWNRQVSTSASALARSPRACVASTLASINSSSSQQDMRSKKIEGDGIFI